MQNIQQFSQFNFMINTSDTSVNNNKNYNGILTQILYSALLDRNENELLDTAFWINPDNLDFEDVRPHWVDDVYVYDIPGDDKVVFTTKHIEIIVSNRFWTTTPSNTDFNDNDVVSSFIKILKVISKYIKPPEESATERKADIEDVTITENDTSEIACEPQESVNINIQPDLITKPTVTRLRNELGLPIRTTRGYRKSYSDLRNMLNIYIIDDNDYDVLPVMNVDMLDYLIKEGGIYIDPLTKVQVTYCNQYITVCTSEFRIEYDTSVRSKRMSIYSKLSSTSEAYPNDLREVSKVLHALNNLYMKYK